MLDREEAVSLLHKKGLEENLIAHCLQTEAVLRHLAERLGRDPLLWGVTGLLHDLDYPHTKDDPSRHGLVTAQELADALPEEALQAIRAHNSEENGTMPENEFDYALRCGESVTGLISANALVRPQGMEGMKPSSLKKKMKDKSFAANVSRERIRECEKLGLELDEFLRIGIEALAAIADQPEAGIGAGKEGSG
ncbi:MAG: HDIG domain-containing protein [Desulfohalobiaceae bacterium]|nr:HDIG domain-containing protein [Desulfohalobiaceae bacterium]